MSRDRSVDDLSEVVRRRLEALLAEIPPRRVAGDASAAPAWAEQVPQLQQGMESSPAGQSGPQQKPGREPWFGAGREPGRRSGFVAGSELGRESESHPEPDGGPRPERELPQVRDGAASAPGSVADESPGRRSPAALLGGSLAALAPRVRQFVRDHLVVVGIVVLTGVLWAGYNLLQTRTTPVAVAAAQPSVEVSAAPVTPSPTKAAQLLVHVLGEVRRPGVVKLAEGARVQDALAAAGGLTRRAKAGDLNLAAPVADGAQLVIGRSGSQVRSATVGAGPGGAVAGKLDLNTATADQLDTLPGVGPVTAQKILSWRAAHGRFRAVAELQEVDGIGPKSYAEIAPRVRV